MSCGGGAVLRPENRAILAERGYVVYLQVTADEAASRISDVSTRPLFRDLDTARATIEARLPLYEDVADAVVDTAGKTNEIVYFGLPYGTNVLYLYVAHPANRMGVLPYRDILGETSPFYCTGIGKAILAHMPEEEWLAHIPAERTRFQPNTITDLDAIVEELRRTRRRGYAIDNSERDPNVRCVGVPVYNSAGKLVAGVSTSGPAITMTDEKLMECAGILQNAALRMRERIYR